MAPAGVDDIIPSAGFHELRVVALGGSAGSVAALQEFFSVVPPDTGMAFVVIMHLSPEHESTMPQLLQRATPMPVAQAEHGMKLEANSVYVIPPGKHLVMIDGHVRLTDLVAETGKRVAVDLFFRSLADTHGTHASAIVLSGVDGDGAAGIKRIKERGGLTIAQDPGEAHHPGMPQSAIATGMVDWILPVAEMPQRLVDYRKWEDRVKVPSEECSLPRTDARSTKSDETALRDVLSFLRTRTGHDFSYYKRATVVRRISRRMQINAVDDLSSYLAFLRTHAGEGSALMQDLLISVTNFFRDHEAFAAVEERMARMFHGKSTADTVRIWVPACATGEEAYSIAILALEHARRLEEPPLIQIFACDLDEQAIRMARAGIYADTITADVSAERLREFFVKETRGYRVRREVRELITFAVHDLLADAPFSRMGLISCRNLLIYLDNDAQKRALALFHFSLEPGGILFLGSSESVEQGSPLFTVMDKKHRIFERSAVARSSVPIPSGSSNAIMRALQAREEGPGSPALRDRSLPHGLEAPMAAVAREDANLSPAELHWRLVERFAPMSLVVNKDYDVVHLSEKALRLVQLSGGTVTTKILQLVHPMLRLELRAALFCAAEKGSPIEVHRVPIELEGCQRAVDIKVSPAGDLAPGFLLVHFELQEGTHEFARMEPLSEAEPIVKRLEREAEAMSARLRESTEQYETSTEELRASNEELHAINEELRSASEELETSREELNSVNEELSSLNQDLKSNLHELAQANSDLSNLMAATAIPTLFLDRQLCIMRFTPSAVPLFHLIPSDVGRPLADLRHQLDYSDFQADAERVLATLSLVEREVAETGPEPRCYLARMLPYRTVDDHISGVVLTFVDVTQAKRATHALQGSEEQLRRAMEDAPIPVIMQAEDGQVLQISRAWTELTGYTPEDIPNFEAWLNRAYGEGAERVRSYIHELFKGSVPHLNEEIAVTTRSGEERLWKFSASAPGVLQDGRRFIIGMALDVTQRPLSGDNS